METNAVIITLLGQLRKIVTSFRRMLPVQFLTPEHHENKRKNNEALLLRKAPQRWHPGCSSVQYSPLPSSDQRQRSGTRFHQHALQRSIGHFWSAVRVLCGMRDNSECRITAKRREERSREHSC
jgi:hypothetical protein